MKILFLTVNLGGGGAERVLVNLANQLSARGYDITVRSLVDTGSNREYLSETVKYEYVFKREFRGIGRLYRLPGRLTYKMLAHGEFDIVAPYLHGVLTRIIADGPKEQKKIAWLHANMENSPFMKQLVKDGKEKTVFSQYDRVVACARTVEESFIKMTGISDRVLTVYNTFDVAGIRRKAKERVGLTASDAAVRLCSVGKLDEVKGYPRLLKAIKQLQDDKLDCSLVIVGEGSQRAELERYIAENGLESCVKLAGFDPNPYKYIANSDLFVCSSYTEGFSSVVAESLILGVPVLTTDCSGMREMLGDNEYGVITENSEEGLYDGLKTLLTESALLEHYRQKAQERSAFFEPESTVGAVEELFKEVMESGG